MSTHPVARVIRAYSLPVSDFDHLKSVQRGLQFKADTSGELALQVTNSVALSSIVRHHELMSCVAASLGMDLTDLGVALYLGELKIVGGES